MYKNIAFSSSQLKIFAYLFMLIDHIGHCMATICVNNGVDFQRIEPLYISMRAIGRLAFPIFCFLLLEGLQHTKSKEKYLIRILVFAIISEPCFDLSFYGTFYNPNYQNVLFTLFISGLYFYLSDVVKKYISSYYIQILINIILIIIAIKATDILHTDYNIAGVILIVGLSLLQKRQQYGTPYAVFIMSLTVFSAFVIRNAISNPAYIYLPKLWVDAYISPAINIQLFEILSLFFILSYNKEAGKPLPKYFYYLFYPVHLLILGCITLYFTHL